jgi:hypothetical protein
MMDREGSTKLHRPHPTTLVPGVKALMNERRAKARGVEDHFPDTLDRLVAENEKRKRKLSRRLELLTPDELRVLRDGLACLEEGPEATEDSIARARAIRADVEAELDLRERTPQA